MIAPLWFLYCSVVVRQRRSFTLLCAVIITSALKYWRTPKSWKWILHIHDQNWCCKEWNVFSLSSCWSTKAHYHLLIIPLTHRVKKKKYCKLLSAAVGLLSIFLKYQWKVNQWTLKYRKKLLVQKSGIGLNESRILVYFYVIIISRVNTHYPNVHCSCWIYRTHPLFLSSTQFHLCSFHTMKIKCFFL